MKKLTVENHTDDITVRTDDIGVKELKHYSSVGTSNNVNNQSTIDRKSDIKKS